MNKKIRSQSAPKQNNVKIILISSLIGVLAGLVSVLYRYALTSAEELSLAMYEFVGSHRMLIPFLLIGLAMTGFLIGKLTKRYWLISGSGIPQVKAQITGYLEGSWLSTLVAKFIGGSVAILSGLSLGREGPSIQLGACVAEGVANKTNSSASEKRIYIASGASAGLAAAFNAPLAGVMFALEEIFKYFSPMVLLSTMVAAIVADFVSKLFFGISHVFDFTVTEAIPIQYYGLFIVLGLILGVSGVFYNKCLDWTQLLYKKLTFIDDKYKPMIPFVLAGILGLTFPIVLCGGHSIIMELDIQSSLLFLIIVFTVKFLFSMISFGSGAPGGIFFPLLVLGSTIGAIFAQIVIPIFGMNEVLFYNFVIIAMAGYFTAIVRAPLTGIILLVEMTGSLSQLLPLIITSAVAYIVAEEMHNSPVYEMLLEKLLLSRGIHHKHGDRTKILLDLVVHHGSAMDGQCLKDIAIPEKCLIVSVKRGEHDITPSGTTIIKAGDYLSVLTNRAYELDIRSQLEDLCIREEL